MSWMVELEDPVYFVTNAKNAEPYELTFAAEALGKVDTEEAAALLVELVRHASPVVREGAVYGLSRHQHRPNVTALLRFVSKMDASPGVRDAAEEALEP